MITSAALNRYEYESARYAVTVQPRAIVLKPTASRFVRAIVGGAYLLSMPVAVACFFLAMIFDSDAAGVLFGIAIAAFAISVRIAKRFAPIESEQNWGNAVIRIHGQDNQ